MHQLAHELNAAFTSHGNTQKSVAMAAYMKNHFKFFGLQKNERSSLQKNFLLDCKQLEIEAVHTIVRQLWQMPERELQYTAMELLYGAKKKWNHSSLLLFEELVTTKSWWDSVDFIAARMIGGYCSKEHQRFHQLFINYANSENLWLQRTAIIHQLFYKENTDTLLFETIFHCTKNNKDFFIQKAIGWALRQYAKTNPEFVKRFVEAHTITGLAKREALKNIEKQTAK